MKKHRIDDKHVYEGDFLVDGKMMGTIRRDLMDVHMDNCNKIRIEV